MPDQFPYDVFLSHSSKDKEIVRPIAERLRTDGLSVWFDEWVLKPGDNLPKKLDDGLEESRVLVLCMSANAFGSDWSQLEAGTFRFRDPLNKERRLITLRLDDAPIKGSLAQFLYIDWLSADREREYARLLEACRLPAKPAALSLAQDRISIARLPTSGRYLFGRNAELQLLDEAWANPNTNIVAFVAWGGVGKTALVNHWLKQRLALENYRGAERAYGWSFFSQGTSERAASADLFIDQALRWFGDQDPTAGSPWDKGERLAGYIRQSRTLLILDGLEPLQYPPGSQEGRLKDAALQAMLVELAAHQSGLCVISTREHVGDLVEFEGGTVVQHELEYLSPQAGAQILRSLNVKGHDEELEEASKEFDGHAFSLTLLGSYLDEVLDGDIWRRKEIENIFADARHGDAAQKMLATYEKWLGEGMELAILRLLGLFDRPADLASIIALREAPVIAGLTEPLQRFKGREWSTAVAKLRRVKLLGEASQDEPGTLDAHPLVRQYFKQQLKREGVDAWREGNKRLYEHLTRTSVQFPETLQDMVPLYAAVAHGCAAGRHEEVIANVLRPRIMRGDNFFCYNKLGAFGAGLAASSNFFEILWDKTIEPLSLGVKASVLGDAGACLRALGRLREATQPLQESLKGMIALESWHNAASAASNLSQLYRVIGDLGQAARVAEQSVELAERGGKAVERLMARRTLGWMLHEAGRAEEAAAIFAEAEAPQLQNWLYSVFPYCDFLLDQREFQEVKKRAASALKLSEKEGHLLFIGLENLLLGRAGLLENKEADSTDKAEGEEFFQRAVNSMRLAGQMDSLPMGLLSRADFHRFNENYDNAERDLAEVLRLATRSGMRLYLADYHLESARLRLAQGNKEKAREHWTTARDMVESMGYHRRDNEVEGIATRLN